MDTWKFSNSMDPPIFQVSCNIEEKEIQGTEDRMSSATCLPGLQGFPVQVTGWSGIQSQEKVDLVIPNDIHIQFSPSETPMAYESVSGLFSLNTNNTFFMGGSQYVVRAIKLSEPKQEGLKTFSANPLFELQIWGSPTPTTIPKADLAVMVIPVYQNPVATAPGIALTSLVRGEAIEFTRCIPFGGDTEIVKYATCIETDQSKTINIAVTYWSKGIAITQDQKRSFPVTPAKFGIPNLFGYKVLSSFVQYSDEARTKGQRQYQQLEGGILTPYQTSVTLSVTTPEFKNAFRIISKFEKKSVSATDTSQYKCIAVNRSRDIKDGKLVIDPKTGKSLADEVKTAEEQQAESLGVQVGARDIWLKVWIGIGIFVGVTLLFGLVVWLGSFFYDRKGQGLPPLDPEIAKQMAELPKNIVGN